MSAAAMGSGKAQVSDGYRWMQVVIGIICMVMIANLQYGWAFFVPPLIAKFHWSGAAVGLAFTLFIAVETWLVPFEGWLIDKYGLGLMIFIGGALAGLGWVINAFAGSLTALYIGQIVAGLGAGIVYGGCVGNAVKWFPDHRGLAAGLTAAGFGLGSALTIIPISSMISNPVYEYDTAFLFFGAGQGIIVVLLSLVLRAPKQGQVAIPANLKVQQSRKEHGPGEAVKTPIFWVMYLMFVLVGVGGLMATANLALYSDQLGVTKTPVTLFGLTLGALVFAKFVDNITNGITRHVCGWISDHIGRET
jgi:MFS transporter, OFA family, oxalate/formate antiporter